MRTGLLFILLAVLGLVSWTAWHFWMILPRAWKWPFTVVYLFSFLLVFANFVWRNTLPLGLATAAYELGNSWMIFFLYAVILFALLGIGRLVHLVPGGFLKDSVAGSATVLGIIAGLLVYGGFHYHHKYREEIVLTTEKALEKPLTIVLASDLHVGYHNRKAELARWVDLINAEHPDLVLFAGDILDGAIRPATEWKYDEEFRRISAPVYASLGNHEYITGIDSSEAFYAKAGIRLLKDAQATVCGITLIGRDDRSNPSRRALFEYEKADSSFTILLDHQPFHLEEAEEDGIDFQFSGHTHHGQVWPLNWVTDAMYEKAFGPHQRGNTRYYISSGLGIWGGRFRIGTRSEYVVLHLKKHITWSRSAHLPEDGPCTLQAFRLCAGKVLR